MMSPAGQNTASRIAFLSGTGRGAADNDVKPASGLGTTEVLGPGNPRSWSPDGRYLIATVGSDLWVLPAASDQKPVAFTDTPFAENFGRFSPDGRWVHITQMSLGAMKCTWPRFRDPVARSVYPRMEGHMRVGGATAEKCSTSTKITG